VRRILFFFSLLLLALPAVIIAQETEPDDCPMIVETALEATDQFCETTGRNEVCYGNIALDAIPQDGAVSFTFEQVGDIVDVVNLSSLAISPMNEETGEWGVALMRLQANLPDTIPGQNVTFILFGDVELVSNVNPEQLEAGEYTPMQSFYLTTGLGDARCREAPESGMLVQTPAGVGEVSFVINEVEVQLGSTILFQAENSNSLTVTALEGAAALRSTNDDEVYPVIAGTRFNMSIIPDNRRIIPIPELPTAYELARLEALPIGLLEREIELRQPLDKTELDALHDRLERGERVCGEDPFPACDRLPQIAGGEPCILPDGDRRRPGARADGNRPLCEIDFDRPNGENDADDDS
jgi:hypothetical protein